MHSDVVWNEILVLQTHYRKQESKMMHY